MFVHAKASNEAFKDEEPLGVITLEGKSKLTMPDNTVCCSALLNHGVR